MPFLERDGVKLYFEEKGVGEPAMLLVHGWTCNHSHFAAQADYFSKSHRVVSVDLRGHGRSDAPQQEYTLDGFADDLAWLCGQLGLNRPIVCGHSMGGFVVLVMAARHPDHVRARILVDSPFVRMEDFEARIGPIVESWKQPDYRPAVSAFIDTMFSPADDPQIRAQITQQMLSTPQHVLTSAMTSIATTDLEAAALSASQPLLVISAGLFAFDMTRARQMLPEAHFGQTVGSGHFNMVEVPGQVNAMIERFLAVEEL